MATERSAWMVAVWPGMGGVAQIAGAYLREMLGMRPLAELPGDDFFESSSIHVEGGLVQRARLPRSMLSLHEDFAAGRDLIVVQGEQQPTARPLRYARALLDLAQPRRIERVFTFAAMATAMHPRDEPRVFAACTTEGMLDLVQKDNAAELLEDAEITGMNGQFLAAARERGIPGLGLLGEVPFFATGLPNPKAAAAVLRAMARLGGPRIAMEELLAQARRIENWLVQHAEGGTASARAAREAVRRLPEHAEEIVPPEPPQEVVQRIEVLFELAKEDRAKAVALKQELDRHGLFAAYEDRFLDLFKKGS